MSTPLKKIVVKNVGVLKAFSTPNSPQLELLTGFYARNGRGKTTLSSILHAASTNDARTIQGRKTLGVTNADPDITLVFSDHSVRFEHGKWQKQIDRIDVFDGAFIADNIYAGEATDLANDRGLFSIILGRDGVKLAKQQEYFVAAAKRSAQRLKETEASLINDLPSGQTREEFFAYVPPENLNVQLAQAEKDVKGFQQAERLARAKRFQKLSIPALPPTAENILNQTIPGIEASARERLAEHFKKFNFGKEGEGWIKFGVEHIHEDNCPFCGKPDVKNTGLVDTYGQIFGDAYKSHFDSIKEMADAIERDIGPNARTLLSSIATENAEAFSTWSEFYSFGEEPLPPLNEAITHIENAHAALKGLFDAKRQSPLLQINGQQEIIQANAAITTANEIIGRYNAKITTLENLIEQGRSSAAASEQQARERLANLQKLNSRTSPGVQGRIQAALSGKRRDARAKKMRSLVQTRLKEKNEQAATHYHGRVNHYLEKFGAKFRISPITNSMSGNAGSVDYGLIVRGHAVSRGRGRDKIEEPSFMNTLSTGDKTTLAFAFFLADIDRHSADDAKKRIIVFDDPLSSHDTHRQGKTVDLLFELSGKCCQVIVLSHDAYFLRRLHRRYNRPTKAAYQIEFAGPEDWSAAELVSLDEVCQSDNAKRLQKVTGFYESRTGDPSDIAPSVRIILETHYRSTYPAYFSATTNLGSIVQGIRDGGVEHPCHKDLQDLDSCNVNTLSQHHGDDPTVPANKPIDPDELHGIAKTCLTLVHAIRP